MEKWPKVNGQNVTEVTTRQRDVTLVDTVFPLHFSPIECPSNAHERPQGLLPPTPTPQLLSLQRSQPAQINLLRARSFAPSRQHAILLAINRPTSRTRGN
jgi:hypothetical protein